MCWELDLLKLCMSFKVLINTSILSNWNKTCWLPLVSSLNLWYLQGFMCPCLQSPHTIDQQESSQSGCFLQFIQQGHQASNRYEHLGAVLSSVTSSIDKTRGISRNCIIIRKAPRDRISYWRHVKLLVGNRTFHNYLGLLYIGFWNQHPETSFRLFPVTGILYGTPLFL